MQDGLVWLGSLSKQQDTLVSCLLPDTSGDMDHQKQL